MVQIRNLKCQVLAFLLFVLATTIALRAEEKLSGDREIDGASLKSLLGRMKNLPDSDVANRRKLGEELLIYTALFLEKYPKDVNAMIIRGALLVELDRKLEGVQFGSELKQLKEAVSPEEKERIVKVLASMNLKGWLSEEVLVSCKEAQTSLVSARKSLAENDWENAAKEAEKVLKVDSNHVETQGILKQAGSALEVEKRKKNLKSNIDDFQQAISERSRKLEAAAKKLSDAKIELADAKDECDSTYGTKYYMRAKQRRSNAERVVSSLESEIKEHKMQLAADQWLVRDFKDRLEELK